MVPNGRNQALKHTLFLLFPGNFGHPAGQLIKKPQTVVKGIVYGVKKRQTPIIIC